MNSRALLSCVAVVPLLAACGGADQRDADRAQGPNPATQNVMYFDSTQAVIPGQKTSSAGGATANGAEVFARCAACHQASGLGVAGAYPPLAGSEWLVNNPEVPIRIVLHGLQGPITVKGASFNNAMTPFGEQLSDDEIAAVISYERSSWGNNAARITPAQVKAVRTATASQTAPWSPADLQPLINK